VCELAINAGEGDGPHAVRTVTERGLVEEDADVMVPDIAAVEAEGSNSHDKGDKVNI